MIKKLAQAALLIIALCELISWPAYSQASNTVTITVDAGQDLGPAKLMQGFLHGFPTDSSFQLSPGAAQYISALQPQYWRLSYGNTYSILMQQAQVKPKVTLVLIDLFSASKGVSNDKILAYYQSKYPGDPTWFDKFLADFEAFAASGVTKAGSLVDYWDIMSEPDWSFLGTSGGTLDQLNKTFAGIHNAIRAAAPNAKILGPCWSVFSSPAIADFLLFEKNNNLRFDGIDWHEFGAPSAVPQDAQAARALFQTDPYYCTPSCPEIHINEFQSSQYNLVPGWTVGWLYFLEKANVDWVTRACWNDKTPSGSVYSNCFAGLDGLFMQDTATPRPLYWVHRAYADLNGRRIASAISVGDTVALANRNDAAGEIRILLGKANGAGTSGNVNLNIQNYPYSPAQPVRIEIDRIPNNNIYGPLLAPIIVSTSTQSPGAGGALNLVLPNVQDGDAYVVVFSTPSAPPNKPTGLRIE